MEHVYCVIMAGGKGERFWPLSTRIAPKPFIRLIGAKTLIQMTFDRALALVPKERIMVVLGQEHLGIAREQLTDLAEGQFIVEPMGRDTAPCIGLAASAVVQRDPEAIMVVLPADHYMPDTDAFVRTVSAAISCAARHSALATIGIVPTRPDTAYGYIQAGKRIETTDSAACYRVGRFVEKPNEAKAREYLGDGSYYWNSGMFVWRASVVLDGIEKHMPDLSEGLREVRQFLATGDRAGMAERFAALPKI
jgi:mannose-1-phosphate guanylyltransferase